MKSAAHNVALFSPHPWVQADRKDNSPGYWIATRFESASLRLGKYSDFGNVSSKSLNPRRVDRRKDGMWLPAPDNDYPPHAPKGNIPAQVQYTAQGVPAVPSIPHVLRGVPNPPPSFQSEAIFFLASRFVFCFFWLGVGKAIASALSRDDCFG